MRCACLLLLCTPAFTQGAGSALTQGVDIAGLSWQQLLIPSVAHQPQVRPATAREQLKFCVDSDFPWSDWEHKFLASVAGWRGSLSWKQRDCLDRLFEKCWTWGQA